MRVTKKTGRSTSSVKLSTLGLFVIAMTIKQSIAWGIYLLQLMTSTLAGNPTGIPLYTTDLELILQPLKFLRNVSNSQISLDPHLQENMSLVDLVANPKKIMESKKERALEDLKILHDTSKDLYHLTGSVYGERFEIF